MPKKSPKNTPENAGKRTLGQQGEEQAAAALEAAGMRILARNVRSRQGEVDIVALDGETVVFVEVKAWSVYGFEDLALSVNLKKQRRIIETANYFLSEHREFNERTVRFDVVFVGKDGVTHLASAFTESV